jgi:uracil-DNA glycosylase
VIRADTQARILIVGQAPGTKVHETGIPWNDASGRRLRDWLGLEPEVFYDESKIAIVPMGLCYPGKGKSGDLPPRPECAATWHPHVLPLLKQIELTLLIGQYAQAYFLGDARSQTLTGTIENWRAFWPRYALLPHPSPRNQVWLKRNPWFEAECVPRIRQRVAQVLAHPAGSRQAP